MDGLYGESDARSGPPTLKAPAIIAVTRRVRTLAMVMLYWFVLSIPVALIVGRLLARSARAHPQGFPGS